MTIATQPLPSGCKLAISPSAKQKERLGMKPTKETRDVIFTQPVLIHLSLLVINHLLMNQTSMETEKKTYFQSNGPAEKRKCPGDNDSQAFPIALL